MKYTLHLYFLIIVCEISTQDEEMESCSIQSSKNKHNLNCHMSATKTPGYIFYDVNSPEGFNLRRDVYMRMASFVKKLNEYEDWHLVLPPWNKLHHWQSEDIEQNINPWSSFFDLPSLKRFAPVMELQEFFQEHKNSTLDHIIILQHFKEGDNPKWEEKYFFHSCHKPHNYKKTSNNLFKGFFWGYNNISAAKVNCVTFHGHASLLMKIIKDVGGRKLMIGHAEVALHDNYGDRLYWQARRSMRFANHLTFIAKQFRKEKLNSTDQADGTVKPSDWQQEQPKSNTFGGPFICAHLRRRDFIWARPTETPSLEWAAKQIIDLMKTLKLQNLFISTDAPNEEFISLKHLLHGYNVVRYEPTATVKENVKDGGVAIIDQIICSHARHFIGSYESTFSFRIQEEREIMGFPAETTFNRLCGDGKTVCSQPSRWKIVF